MTQESFKTLKNTYIDEIKDQIAQSRLLKLFKSHKSARLLRKAYNVLRQKQQAKNDINLLRGLLSIVSVLKKSHIMRLSTFFLKLKQNYIKTKIQEKCNDVLKQEKKEIKAIRAQLT